MGRRKTSEKQIMKEMAEIAFSSEEKTADRLRALDMLSSLMEKEGKRDEAFEKLDALLSVLGENR